MRRVLTVIMLGFGLTLGACSTFMPGNLEASSTAASQDRVGRVYLLRGLFSVFSQGIDSLSDELKAAGVKADAYHFTQADDVARNIIARYRRESVHEPVILIGHSFGADNIVRIARHLNEAKVPVALLVPMDAPNTPRITPNVQRTLNYYLSNSPFKDVPMLRGVPAVAAGGTDPATISNYDLVTNRRDLLSFGVSHYTLDKSAKVQGEIVGAVLQVALPRQVWLTQMQQPPVTAFSIR